MGFGSGLRCFGILTTNLGCGMGIPSIGLSRASIVGFSYGRGLRIQGGVPLPPGHV